MQETGAWADGKRTRLHNTVCAGCYIVSVGGNRLCRGVADQTAWQPDTVENNKSQTNKGDILQKRLFTHQCQIYSRFIV